MQMESGKEGEKDNRGACQPLSIHEERSNLLFLSLPTCSPLSCGEPPIVQFASHGLNNSSFLVGELAVYTCDNGFLMVVNSSNSPVATEQVCCLAIQLPAVPKISVFIFLKFMRFRRQLCACHQALGAQHTTWPAWTPPSLARAGWSRPASPSTSSTSCLPFSLSSLFLSSFSIVVAGACALLVPGGCQSVELYPPTTSPGSLKNSQRRQSGALEGILAHLLPPRHLFLPQTLLDQGFTVCRQD